MALQITFLGSSASVPTKKSLPSCFAVKYEKVLLFDACEGVQKQLMTFKTSFAQVRAIFLSHLHADHFLGVFGLVQTLNMSGRNGDLLIFGPKGTKELFETVFSLSPLKALFKIEITESTGAEKKALFETDTFTVKAFKVKHGGNALGFVLEEKEKRRFDKKKCDAAGIKGALFRDLETKKTAIVGKKVVKIEDVSYLQKGKKLVYTGDTSWFAGLKKEFEGADLVVADSTFLSSEELLAKEKEHCTVLQVAKAAKESGVKKLVLTHFSNRYEDRTPLLEEGKGEFEECVLAEEGLELTL